MRWLLPFLLLAAPAAAEIRSAEDCAAAIAADPARAREEAAVWQRVCVPASQGLLAHALGDWQGAVEGLGQAMPRLLEIGGSHAQRDLFAQVHLDALVKSGHTAGAQNLLQQQLRAQPESKRLQRQAGRLYAALGLPSVSSFF